MLEDYLKRIEDLITPKCYSKINFRDKIKGELEDPAEFEKRLENVDENRKLIEEYLKKMDIKDLTEDEGKFETAKLKIYQKILDNNQLEEINSELSPKENSKTQSNWNNKMHNYSLSPTRRINSSRIDDPKEKIHSLNIKNMNYRYEIESLKRTVSELNKIIERQNLDVEKLEKQNESNNKYLIKLEMLLSQRNLNLNFNKSSVTNLNFSPVNNKNENIVVDFNKTNNLIIEDKMNNQIFSITDRNDLKDLIGNLISENIKLKEFKNKVYEISKNYDDLNESIVEGLKNIQNSIAFSQNVNIENILKNLDMTLQAKHREYNHLLETKDEEIKILQEEIIQINNYTEITKRDRMKDQKQIIELENEIFIINRKMQESERPIEQYNNSASLKLEKKIQPAKTLVNKIIKKIEKNFDLQDKSNVKFLSNINKNIK